MSSPVDITEGPPSDPTWGPDGLTVGRNFDVLAYSAFEAMAKLDAQKGQRRGVVYRDHLGNTPDPFAKLDRFTIKGMPHAAGSGLGMYRITAFYLRKNNGGSQTEPVPGGPPIWEVRGQLTSKPVDHTIEGFPIANTVEEPGDPPVTAMIPGEKVFARWYQEGPDNLVLNKQFRKFRGAVNQNVFLGASKGCLLCHGVEVRPPEDGWCLCEAAFEYEPPKTLQGIDAGFYYTPSNEVGAWAAIAPPIEGWAEIRINRGRRTYVEGTAWTDPPEKRYKKIVDASGQPVSDGVLLTGTGTVVLDRKPRVLVFFRQPYQPLEEIGIRGSGD